MLVIGIPNVSCSVKCSNLLLPELSNLLKKSKKREEETVLHETRKGYKNGGKNPSYRNFSFIQDLTQKTRVGYKLTNSWNYKLF